MSYHDGYDPRNEGISVVNPLIQIERRFNKIKKLLSDEDRVRVLTTMQLRSAIMEILNE